jgi:hypothetical protein
MGNAKVNDLGTAFMNKDVPRLEVAVNYSG